MNTINFQTLNWYKEFLDKKKYLLAERRTLQSTTATRQLTAINLLNAAT